MLFRQHEDCSFDLEFNDQEIENLNKNKKLIFDPVDTRHFCNTFMRILVDLNSRLPKEVQNLTTDNAKNK